MPLTKVVDKCLLIHPKYVFYEFQRASRQEYRFPLILRDDGNVALPKIGVRRKKELEGMNRARKIAIAVSLCTGLCMVGSFMTRDNEHLPLTWAKGGFNGT